MPAYVRRKKLKLIQVVCCTNNGTLVRPKLDLFRVLNDFLIVFLQVQKNWVKNDFLIFQRLGYPISALALSMG